MSARPWLCIALLLGLFASPAVADAPSLVGPTVPTARQHFVHGNRLYRVRKFEEAITAYQAGAVIEPAPIFDFNLGQCYRQLDRYADALWHYERFLRNGPPDHELRSLVTELVQRIRAELERKSLTQRPTGVATVPGSPRTFAEVRAQRDRLATGVATVPGSPRTARSVPSGPTAELSSSIAAREGASPPWYADTLGWTLLGGGVLGVGGTGVLLAIASDLRHDASSSLDEVRRAELHDAARVRRLGSIALGIGSAVLIATGGIKLAIHPSERPRPRSSAWDLGVTRHGVAVLGRF